MCDFGWIVLSVSSESLLCVIVTTGCILRAALELTMQECAESCWVAHYSLFTAPRLLLKVPISAARETIGPRMAATDRATSFQWPQVSVT